MPNVGRATQRSNRLVRKIEKQNLRMRQAKFQQARKVASSWTLYRLGKRLQVQRGKLKKAEARVQKNAAGVARAEVGLLGTRNIRSGWYGFWRDRAENKKANAETKITGLTEARKATVGGIRSKYGVPISNAKAKMDALRTEKQYADAQRMVARGTQLERSATMIPQIRTENKRN